MLAGGPLKVPDILANCGNYFVGYNSAPTEDVPFVTAGEDGDRRWHCPLDPSASTEPL